MMTKATGFYINNWAFYVFSLYILNMPLKNKVMNEKVNK